MGKIVSCCFLLIVEKPSNPSFINGRTGTVLNVYTKPDYRRKGCAYALMEMLIADSKAMNLDFIKLKSTENGYGLYKKLGFIDEVSHYRNMKLVLD